MYVVAQEETTQEPQQHTFARVQIQSPEAEQAPAKGNGGERTHARARASTTTTHQLHLQHSQLVLQPILSGNYSFAIFFELSEPPRLLAACSLLGLQHCPQHLLWDCVGLEGVVVLHLRFFRLPARTSTYVRTCDGVVGNKQKEIRWQTNKLGTTQARSTNRCEC